MRVRRATVDWMLRGYPLGASALGMYRIMFAGLELLALFPTYVWVGRYPNAFWFPPPGPLRLLHGFPPVAVLRSLEVAVGVALVSLLLGYRTKLASYAVGVLIIVGNGFFFGFGRISHQILAPLLAIVFAESGWGSALSIDSQRGRKAPVQTWTVSLILLATGLVMLTSALPKLLLGWLSPHSNAAVSSVVWLRAGFGSHFRFPLPAGPVAEVLDWGTVLFEITFLAAVFVPNVGRVYIAAATLFHLGVLMSLEIDFSRQLLVYGVLLPWDAIGRRLSGYHPAVAEKLMRRVADHPVVACGCAAVAYLALEDTAGPPLRLMFWWTSDPEFAVSVLVHAVAAAIGVAYLVYAVARVLRHRSFSHLFDVLPKLT